MTIRGLTLSARAITMKRIRHIIIIALLAVVLVVMILRYSAPTRVTSTRAVCMSNMSQIASALLIYENLNGHFPPPYTVDENGKPLHSWRTLILPIIEHKQLFDNIRFDEPWNSEYNKQFHDITIPLFHCRSAKPTPDSTSTSTYYDVVVGPNTAFPSFDGETQPKVSVDDISVAAGTSFTLLLVERKTPVHWMQPSGIDIDDLPNEIDWRHNGNANFAFVDRSIRSFSQKLPPDVLKRLGEWKGWEKSDVERIPQALREDVQAGSADWERVKARQIFIVQLAAIGVAVFVCLMLFVMIGQWSRPSGDCGGVPPSSPAP